MNVAVIGGSRHIGPAIVRALLGAKHSVSIYNRGRTPTEMPDTVQRVVVDRKIPGQIAAALRDHRPDAVIDLIAFVPEDVAQVIDALPALQHYVFCSSTVAYGLIRQSTPSESTPDTPDSPYGEGKVACERLMVHRHRERGLRYTSLRMANPYGPGDQLVYTCGRDALFLDRMRHGRPVLIPGQGDSRIHSIHIDDVARAFVHVLDRPDCLGRVFNLAGDKILTLNEYFASIARALEVPLIARHVDHHFFRDQVSLWEDWDRKFDFGFNWNHYESAFDVAALHATGFRCRTDHDTGVAEFAAHLKASDGAVLSSNDDEENRILSHLGN